MEMFQHFIIVHTGCSTNKCSNILILLNCRKLDYLYKNQSYSPVFERPEVV